jgi:hypothetical protein
MMMKPMQPIEVACDVPSLSDANGHGRAKRSLWGSLYLATGSKGEDAR